MTHTSRLARYYYYAEIRIEMHRYICIYRKWVVWAWETEAARRIERKKAKEETANNNFAASQIII